MTCAACGGDGQIEVGAYRGDDDTNTRECRLCGGHPGVELAKFNTSESGKRRSFTLVGSPQPDNKQQREVATAIANAAAIRRKEQVERSRQERLAHPVTLPNTNQMSGDEIMNALIRELK